MPWAGCSLRLRRAGGSLGSRIHAGIRERIYETEHLALCRVGTRVAAPLPCHPCRASAGLLDPADLSGPCHRNGATPVEVYGNFWGGALSEEIRGIVTIVLRRLRLREGRMGMVAKEKVRATMRSGAAGQGRRITSTVERKSPQSLMNFVRPETMKICSASWRLCVSNFSFFNAKAQRRGDEGVKGRGLFSGQSLMGLVHAERMKIASPRRGRGSAFDTFCSLTPPRRGKGAEREAHKGHSLFSEQCVMTLRSPGDDGNLLCVSASLRFKFFLLQRKGAKARRPKHTRGMAYFQNSAS
jgi:hypothetical protein